MFKFFVLNSFFKIVFIAALVLFLGLFVYAYQLDQKNKPLATNQTPFISTLGVPKIINTFGESDNPLAKQNIAGREIVKMLNDIIPETLSFNGQNYVTNKSAVSKYFTDTAYEQYVGFLTTAGFDTNLSSQVMHSGVFIEQPPLEVSSGVFNGVYKWLFEIPVSIYFVAQNSDNEGGTLANLPLNKRALLRVQFTRVQDKNNPDAIKIEIWQAVSPKKL